MSRSKASRNKKAIYRQIVMFFLLSVSLVSAFSLYLRREQNPQTFVTSYEFGQGDIFDEDVKTNVPVQYHPSNNQLLFTQTNFEIRFSHYHYHRLTFLIEVGSLDDIVPSEDPIVLPTFSLTWGRYEKNITVTECDVYMIEFEGEEDGPLMLTYHRPVRMGTGWMYQKMTAQSIKIIGHLDK